MAEVLNKSVEAWGIWYDGSTGYTPGYLQGAGGFSTFPSESAAQEHCDTAGAAYKPRQVRITTIVETVD